MLTQLKCANIVDYNEKMRRYSIQNKYSRGGFWQEKKNAAYVLNNHNQRRVIALIHSKSKEL